MIKDFRLALKMTRQELADLAELDMETVKTFEENGFPGETGVNSIFLLSKALRVSVDTLVYFNDNYAVKNCLFHVDCSYVCIKGE